MHAVLAQTLQLGSRSRHLASSPAGLSPRPALDEPDKDHTKPYKFIGFGAMGVTKPYKFIGFGAMDVTKPYKFMGFGAMDVTKPYIIYRVTLLHMVTKRS